MKNLKNIRDANDREVPKHKERHIVSWSQEEDDILREQIRIHGSENWVIIASKFKDKTTRQCRRRWYTYLNTDFKKGGWTPEEDMLLCEAQKIFGNRWTEIAKVVLGRTDNAVKNRFTTLCKKKAKHEAVEKENNTTSYINVNNKRVIFPNGFIADKGSENSVPLKKLRIYTSRNTENCKQEEKSAVKCGVTDNLVRHPFAVIDENIHVQENCAAKNNKIQGTFLKKDDPKVLALIRQAELLSSLAIKVNSNKTDQNLEIAWMTLQDYLKQNKVSDPLESKISDANISLEKFKELMENLSSSNESSKQSQRDPDVRELSPISSEYSTGSYGICHIAASPNEEENILTCNYVKANDGAKCECSNTEFSSPVHVVPLFRSLAATIPTPEFSESEKHFLMKTLGMESPSLNPTTNPSKPPPCKRSLLHCL